VTGAETVTPAGNGHYRGDAGLPATTMRNPPAYCLVELAALCPRKELAPLRMVHGEDGAGICGIAYQNYPTPDRHFDARPAVASAPDPPREFVGWPDAHFASPKL
jgi:hypothetical protein